MSRIQTNRRGYPLYDDIKQAIKEVTAKGRYPPFRLCEEVSKLLKKRGFYTGHVNVKKVWKLYLELQEEEKLRLSEPV